MPKIPLYNQLHRQATGDYINKQDKKAGGHDRQDELIRWIASNPGLNTKNVTRQNTAHVVLQLISLITSIQNNNIQCAASSRRTVQLSVQDTRCNSDDLYQQQNPEIKTHNNSRILNGKFDTVYNQPKISPYENGHLTQSTLASLQIEGKPFQPLVTELITVSNIVSSKVTSIANKFTTMLHRSEEFIRQYDPLIFPSTNALHVSRRQHVGKRNSDHINTKSLNDNISDLSESDFNLEKRYASRDFLNTGQQAITTFYDEYNTKYPGLKKLASSVLKDKIKQRFNISLEPDNIYFMHFDLIKYDGGELIQHDPPREKKTLTECLFTNFDASIQTNMQDMDAMCGIYDLSVKKNKEYHSSDAKKIKPTEFIQLVWDIDFYDFAINKFTENFRYKNRHIKKYFIDYIHHLNLSKINTSAAEDVLKGAGILNNSDISVTKFDINGYVASTAFVFRNDINGRVTLYFPQSDFKFISFTDDFKMRSWVANACGTKKYRNIFESHFTISNRQDGAFYYGVDSWLNSINHDRQYYNKIANKSSKITSDNFFEHLFISFRDKILVDLDSLIKSDAEIRRDMWEEIIDASNIIPNPVSPLLSFSLHLEHAIDADNYDEKRQELIKINTDALSIVTMILLDKVMKSPDVDGYYFINDIKKSLRIKDMKLGLKKKQIERNDLNNYINDDKIKDEIYYDKKNDCYRVKRGLGLGKLCSGSNELQVTPKLRIDRNIVNRVKMECENIANEWNQLKINSQQAEQANLDKLINLASNMHESPILDEYIEAGNQGINNFLRYGVDTKSGQYEKDATELQNAYNELIDYRDFSYRIINVPLERYNTIKKGDILVDKGFSSSSALIKNAQEWSSSGYIKSVKGDIKLLIVYDKDVNKKIAGNSFLTDHIITPPREKVQVVNVHPIDDRTVFAILGVTSYSGKTIPKDIYSGKDVL